MEAERDRSMGGKEMKKQRIFIFVLSILLVVLIGSFRDYLRDWQKLGYIGLFLINLIASSTVFFPIPGIATVFVGGALWNPFVAGWASGLGAGLGELSGYFLGYGGRGLGNMKKKDKKHWFTRFEMFFHRSGFLTTFLFAMLPMPFDVVGVFAGAVGYPVWKFLLATILGRGIRNSVNAWTGAKVLPL